MLPLEAGDVEWCSAVSDYQALLCEWNDNHCAALQRERSKTGGEGVRDREKKEEKGYERRGAVAAVAIKGQKNKQGLEKTKRD